MNPNIPICRYELNGICNDTSCQSQHFKPLGLSGASNQDLKACVTPLFSSNLLQVLPLFTYTERAQADTGLLTLADEKILVDLGALPDRSDITAFDASAYTDGLRKLIQDIRSRKVKDVNEVASEITAYRRKFLGDFRILSL